MVIFSPGSYVPTPESYGETRGVDLTVINYLMFAVMTLVVAARLYARFKLSKTAGLDDALILFTYVSLLGGCSLTLKLLAVAQQSVIQFYLLPTGANKHTWALTPNETIENLKATFIGTLLFFWPVSVVKLSILAYYRRTPTSIKFQPPLRIVRITVIVLSTFVIIYLLACTLFTLLHCKPLSYSWERFSPGSKGTCYDSDSFGIATGAANLVLDFAILLLSFYVTWSLNLPQTQRLWIGLLLGTGILTCVAGTLRVYFLDTLLRRSHDPVWTGWWVWIFSILEVNISVICASLPACKAFVAMCLEQKRERKQSLKTYDLGTISSA